MPPEVALWRSPGSVSCSREAPAPEWVTYTGQGASLHAGMGPLLLEDKCGQLVTPSLLAQGASKTPQCLWEPSGPSVGHSSTVHCMVLACTLRLELALG